ncbi:hypothetical protein LK540_23605 [Massilia sp. IC2-278]|uniref:hypothetical protein n=1 Tax=Massilia sp. IC2-278 TaxID=2887200 RepID=UPI001E585A3A|nr:hypothetical protein [Massilia sp. IC2-278]MCC2963429.1 hypothetical protein [Massilia sp. IC2-278]
MISTTAVQRPLFSPDTITRYQADQYTHGAMHHTSKAIPEIFLEYASEDLPSGASEKLLINSLSNAKRALHAQVEILCEGFGASNLNKQLQNFPSRLDFLEKCGILRPRIFRKINNLRNLVEHEYHIPTQQQAEDFIDIVYLFLDAVKIFRYNQPYDIEWFDEVYDFTGTYQLKSMHASWAKGKITLRSQFKGAERQDPWITQEISVNDPAYFIWVKMMLQHDY